MAEPNRTLLIRTTAGEVAEELARLGIPANQRVTVEIEPDDWLARARAYARRPELGAPLSDDDVDQLIEEEREAVHRRRG